MGSSGPEKSSPYCLSESAFQIIELGTKELKCLTGDVSLFSKVRLKMNIPFSAFWLRSSVVSVLISLISDMRAIGSHDIKLIFLGGGSITAACCSGSRESLRRCTTAFAWLAPLILSQIFSC
ncbi:hypothetical protein MIMGU_mgv1a024460mg [Erythranthe guttata]|uniref:Uncharacterized protein n=1 Tax=Erythranthe guttata TaxID=4155 RepID=A0A022QMU3_ERYGU|nr:hypothetical protein MIMGU_mgv1a024460mg [Erythranthe guttata]